MKKRLIAVLLATVIMLSALSCGFNAAALVMCETQYSYDSPDMSWLKDLIVKENMTTVSGLSSRCTYVAKSSYPYNATAESFKEDIAYYQTLYTLDENMVNAAYIYMLEIVKAFAGNAMSSDYSDEFIRNYLESFGIVYPSGENADSSETLIVARALFSIISSDDSYTVKKGTGLYEAFTAYISTVMGVNINTILKFDGDSNLSDIKEYIVAACKYSLYQAGYPVSKDTSDTEVYRLIAIMTIRAQGITIDSKSATFEEIRNKYLCAMMCKIYGLSVDEPSFTSAVKKNNLAFYMLQLIGKKSGITIKDSLTYEEAFKTACEKTDFFNLTEGEFYADIFEYDIKLKYKRESIWIYPQTLAVNSESDGTAVSVKINDSKVKENYYNEISIDSSKEKQTVTILVEYSNSSGAKKSSQYKLNITEGTEIASTGTTISGALAGVAGTVSNVLQEMGLNSSITEIIANIPFELPQRLLSITSLIVPSFDSNSLGSGFLQYLFGYSKNDDSNVNTNTIGGVGGLDSYVSSTDSSLSMNFNTSKPNGTIGQLDINSLIAETTTNQANSLIINDEPQSLTYPSTNITEDSGGWFSELIHDTKTVIILAVVLLVTFGVCLTLFMKIFSERKDDNGKPTEKKEKVVRKTKTIERKPKRSGAKRR